MNETTMTTTNVTETTTPKTAPTLDDLRAELARANEALAAAESAWAAEWTEPREAAVKRAEAKRDDAQRRFDVAERADRARREREAREQRQKNLARYRELVQILDGGYSAKAAPLIGVLAGKILEIEDFYRDQIRALLHRLREEAQEAGELARSLTSDELGLATPFGDAEAKSRLAMSLLDRAGRAEAHLIGMAHRAIAAELHERGAKRELGCEPFVGVEV